MQGHAVAGELLQIALAEGQRVRLRVASGSMWPLLRPGDQVEVTPVPLADLRPGALVVRAVPDGSFVVHRLLGLQGETIITGGDALPRADPPWPADQLAGRVSAAWRGGRPIRLAARWPRPLGRLLAGWLRLRSLAGRLCRWMKHK